MIAVSREEIKVNYHSFLGELRVFDPILSKMRNQDLKWRGQAWAGPAKLFRGAVRSASLLGKIGWGSIPVVGPGLIAAGGYVASLPLWMIIVTPILLMFFVYWILVIRCTGQMASIGHPNFHVGCFKAKRPKEYQLWAPFFKNHNASFEGLYAFLTPILTAHHGDNMNALIEYTRGQVDAMQTDVQKYRSDRDYLQAEVERYVRALSYLVDLIKATNKSLYRLVNDCMNFYELDFVCAYTIYEVDGDVIRKIHDKGTTGVSPSIIALTEENAEKYAAVNVAMQEEDEEDGPTYNNPFPGRTVVSYRMKMLAGEVWIWNFHFDDSNDRALNLTLSNDIIEIREVYRLIHSFCLILQKRDIVNREGIHHAGASKTAN